MLRIPLLFILISVPWIVLSDHWLLRWAPDIASYGYFQSIKGFLFIFVTAGLLYRQAYNLFQEVQHTNRVLAENHRYLAEQFCNLPGMAYQCRNEPDWPMKFLSEGCYALTGYPRDAFLREDAVTFQELIHPGDRQRVWETVQQALQNRQPYQLEYRIRTAGGQEKWVWERGKGIYDAQGGVLHLEGFISDITDRKQAEDAL
ncbi:MAG TPA: PAS domain-containing protein, partial [bacterium]|nr:PAS domain-containing protein [bacterium]